MSKLDMKDAGTTAGSSPVHTVSTAISQLTTDEMNMVLMDIYSAMFKLWTFKEDPLKKLSGRLNYLDIDLALSGPMVVQEAINRGILPPIGTEAGLLTGYLIGLQQARELAK